MGMIRPTDGDWKVVDVQHLYHKAVTSIALEREDGKRLYVNVSDEAFESGSMTAYFPSDSQAKENPQGIDSDDESIVGAGTDFLMKVTEEAVITGMILARPNGRANVRDKEVRGCYRDAAEDITLEEVKRFVADENSPFTFRPREEDPACESDDSVIRAAHGVPAPHGFEKVGPPRILPADRYAPGAVIHLDPSEEFQKWAEEEHEKYLDATQGK